MYPTFLLSFMHGSVDKLAQLDRFPQVYISTTTLCFFYYKKNNYLSSERYTFRALMINEFSGVAFQCDSSQPEAWFCFPHHFSLTLDSSITFPGHNSVSTKAEIRFQFSSLCFMYIIYVICSFSLWWVLKAIPYGFNGSCFSFSPSHSAFWGSFCCIYGIADGRLCLTKNVSLCPHRTYHRLCSPEQVSQCLWSDI